MFHVKHLAHHFSTINHHHLACDERGSRRSEKESNSYNIVRCAPATQWYTLLYALAERFRTTLRPRRLDPTWRNAIHTYARSQLFRQATRHSYNGPFAGRVHQIDET